MIDHKLRSVLVGASLAALVAATPAVAGTAADVPADEEAQPGEIIVTAQKREQRLQDVPISLAVVSGNTLADRSIQSFEQLAPLIPNLMISKSVASNLISLRGIGSGTGSPSLDQSVVLFIDGIYAGNARQFVAPFLDIERLEVLRGPQGALVGRNTSAGAINIVTRKPGKEFGGYVNADYNFLYDGPTLEGGVDVPLSESFAIRAVGKYADLGGYIHNVTVGKDQPSRREISGRITAVLDSGPVRMTAKYEHADVKGEGSPVQPVAPAAGQYFDYIKDSRLLTGPEFDNLKSDNAALQFDVDLGGPTLVLISGYSAFNQVQRVDADFYARDLSFSDFDQKFEQLSQEIRLVSEAGQTIEYVLGAYYSEADLLEQRTTATLFAPASSSYRSFDQDSRVYSIYGQLTYNLGDRFKVNGSLRYTNERKQAVYRRYTGAQAATDRIGTLAATIIDELQEGRVDPALSLQFTPNSDAMFYLSYGKGSKSGGFQGAISNAAPFSFQFAPERSESYEVGTKLTLPGIGYVNLAAFHTTYKGLQVSVALPSPDGLTAPFFTGNAPEARVIGAEAELFLRPVNGFEINGSLAWLPTAKYIGFTNGPCYVGQTPNGTQPGSCNLDGVRLGYASKYSGSFTFTYIQPAGSDLEVRASLSPIFQGPSIREFSADPQLHQDSWLKLDARIALAQADGNWELALVGRNLTNRRTLGFGSSGGLANTFLSPTARLNVIDPPRAISVQARYRF
ncbi:TonB-dependent receptor [Sphingomonas colocasiae]|uniref:TonB-dependent receptor n=1 Tax=Sphingomonas colocasiae TaxID=1848973 RepID=A0ABS7PWI6_9SPHN|nr:TonB-dependent receptor [Sphingomonas colocasiae]MBY8825727.1 TonB-dependent receptor [Sphingomonas colocasiae]